MINILYTLAYIFITRKIISLTQVFSLACYFSSIQNIINRETKIYNIWTFIGIFDQPTSLLTTICIIARLKYTR